MKMMMISCFDHSTIMAQPWAEAGFECYCVDLQHPKGMHQNAKGIWLVGADIREWLPPRHLPCAFASFFPPCTDVAVCGSRWFQDKGLGALIAALQCFDASVKLAENLACPYLIENPRSTVSTYWRKPDFVFSPSNYGDAYEKATFLWTGGGFRMPPPSPRLPLVAINRDFIHLIPSSKSQAAKRSRTPRGFARACFESNRP